MTSKQYKDLSIKEFTKAAEVYETDHAGVYNMCKKDYPDVLAELEKEPFDRLLDCGCGTAPMISLLHEKYPEKHYTGIDLTPKMIEAAKSKQLPGVEFVVGDCEHLPFEAECFDTVICCESFHARRSKNTLTPWWSISAAALTTGSPVWITGRCASIM